VSKTEALLARLLARHRALLVFGTIGVANTLLHSATVVALVENGLAGPVPAKVSGFVLANCHFTFRQPPSWRRYRAFLVVSLLSLALTIGLSALAEGMHWHYLVGLAMVLLFGPVLTYALHKAITFRTPA
jgi:putative flippase GtrA